jgi:catechol 2,3-dioxygenase-like lactoylglutathione lyase family enzyme
VAGPNPAFGLAKIVAFDVRDLSRAVAFYVGRLGFPVVEEKPGEFVMVDTGPFRLCLDQGERDQNPAGEQGRLLFEVPNVDATAKVLEEAKLPYARKRGKTASYLEVGDPDGHVLVFSEKL